MFVKKNKILIIICIGIAIFLLVNFLNKPEKISTDEYIKQELYIDISGCNIEIDDDEHWDFLVMDIIMLN